MQALSPEQSLRSQKWKQTLTTFSYISGFNYNSWGRTTSWTHMVKHYFLYKMNTQPIYFLVEPFNVIVIIENTIQCNNIIKIAKLLCTMLKIVIQIRGCPWMALRIFQYFWPGPITIVMLLSTKAKVVSSQSHEFLPFMPFRNWSTLTNS